VLTVQVLENLDGFFLGQGHFEFIRCTVNILRIPNEDNLVPVIAPDDSFSFLPAVDDLQNYFKQFGVVQAHNWMQ
jgi:hypothetical protein